MKTLLLSILLLIPTLANAAPLTPGQQSYIAAQVEARFGAFEKIVVRRVRSHARFPFVGIATKPRIVSDHRVIYGLIDDEHSQEPCIVFGAITVDHAVVSIGTWPAGDCSE